MIKCSKQHWQIGQTVKVGFVTGLVVFAAIATPGDGLPDEYILVRGEAFYSFVPHNGMTRLTREEALERSGAKGIAAIEAGQS